MGLTFHESWQGTIKLYDHPEQERTVVFEIDNTIPSLLRFLRQKTAEIYGYITMAGVATEKPMQGTLGVAGLFGQKLTYKINFTSNDGLGYGLEGAVNISVLRPWTSSTTMKGLIYREGEEVGEIHGKFPFEALPKFFASWSLA